MRTPSTRGPGGPTRNLGLLGLLLPLLATAGCAGGGAPGPTPTSGSEAVWERLNRPRPAPLEGAARVTVGEIALTTDPWSLQLPVSNGLGLQELVSAGLLRRRDVNFVERRRFAAAAEQERRGESRPVGAPPVGVSPGAELVLHGTWAPVGTATGFLEMRLVDAGTGNIVESFRLTAPGNADPASLARTMVGGLLATLREMGRLPAWEDPTAEAAPGEYRPSGIPVQAAGSFFQGVAAEDRYDWEGARRLYQAALDAGGPGFFEAEVALARIARLRAGGSLGAGDDV